MTKVIQFEQLFTPEQLEKIVKLANETPIDLLPAVLRAEITEPLIDQINAKTQQENDPAYIAYAMTESLGRIAKKKVKNFKQH